jgi:hypothetical protein
MAKSETWYDSQANAAKLISYAALLVLLGSIGWAFYSALVVTFAPAQSQPTATAPATIIQTATHADYHTAVFSVIAGITASAFLYGLSAIIDLLIVQCEALRTRR